MKALFDVLRRIGGGALAQDQVDGVNVILASPDCAGWDRRWIAYALATAWHETGGRMQPVREGFASDDAGAIRAVTRLFERGAIRRNYAMRDPATGQSYYGRGLVQLTHRENYARAGDKLGLPLDVQPDLALEPDVSAAILLRGCAEGWFTGKRLADYFSATTNDPIGARGIVNGTDRAEYIALLYRDILAALPDAPAQPVEPPAPVGPAADLLARIEALEARLDRMAKALAGAGSV